MIATGPDDITAAVLAEAARTPDARQRELLTAAVRHLHAFAREVRLTEAELFRLAAALARAGQMTTLSHNEVMLGAGSLGHGDDTADAVRTGVGAAVGRTGVDAVCTGAACFGFAARSVLRATCSFCGGGDAGAASDFDPPNKLPIRPAIEVGFSCWAGASPCLGCGAG